MQSVHWMKEKSNAVCELSSGIYKSFFTGIFEKRQEICPYQSAAELLLGLLPDKLIKMFRKQKKDLCDTITSYELEVKDSSGFEQAQVCSGGVDTSQVNPETLESVLHKGLYFAGELLDIDGPCGGYNLQWAWSSGVVAGRSSAKENL